jgi:hypothetical protein
MTKLYTGFMDSNVDEKEVITSIIENENDGPFYMGSSLDDLAEVMEDSGETPSSMAIFVFEIVDKGKIETSHKFVSSKKIKEAKPA